MIAIATASTPLERAGLASPTAAALVAVAPDLAPSRSELGALPEVLPLLERGVARAPVARVTTRSSLRHASRRAAVRSPDPAPRVAAVSRGRALEIAGLASSLLARYPALDAPTGFEAVATVIRAHHAGDGAAIVRVRLPASLEGQAHCIFGTPMLLVDERLVEDRAVDVLLHEWAHALLHFGVPFLVRGRVVPARRAAAELEADLFVTLIRGRPAEVSSHAAPEAA